MIEVRNLSKQFGAFTAVRDISFSMGRGEVLGFLGPNGAGKSTTMKMITGFLAPSSGTVRVCGHDVASTPLPAKKSIGYLPEGAPAYPDMTPRGFLQFVARIRGFKGAELTQRVDGALERANLGSVAYKTIDTLSKGFKRRVGIAQAILHDPQVLIMDEPTDGLDPNQKHEMRVLIQEMAKDKAIIVSTHILEEVHAVCTRAIIIAQGALLFDGTPGQLEERSRYHNAVRLKMAVSSMDSVVQQLRGLAYVADVSIVGQSAGRGHFMVFPKNSRSIVHELGQHLREQACQVDELSVESGRLDEVFRVITTGSAADVKEVLS